MTLYVRWFVQALAIPICSSQAASLPEQQPDSLRVEYYSKISAFPQQL